VQANKPIPSIASTITAGLALQTSWHGEQFDEKTPREAGPVGYEGTHCRALGRIGQPDDIAQVAVFLVSGDSGWITGERILASGGRR
jgi:NAD(P)-dependent dehydrogenase (short-subunit alcohol dehydrogenase family)